MGTTIRPETSKKNLYWLEKHRYYELKHFCLQYPTWKREYSTIEGYSRRPVEMIFSSGGTVGDPTTISADAKLYYYNRMKMVEDAAVATNIELARYIFVGVTEGLSYDHLKARLDIPCGKETYYKLYRRFFWLLSKARN